MIITYKGTHIKLSANFSAQILQTRREWNDTFKAFKERLYLVNSSFRNKGEIKTFPDKKLRQIITTLSALLEMLKGVL